MKFIKHFWEYVPHYYGASVILLALLVQEATK